VTATELALLLAGTALGLSVGLAAGRALAYRRTRALLRGLQRPTEPAVRIWRTPPAEDIEP
jgi:hypothetical protein